MGRFKKEERATRNLEYWIEANQRTIENGEKNIPKNDMSRHDLTQSATLFCTTFE